MYTIARLTFLEVFRKKVFLVTVILSAVFIFLYGLALDFYAQEMLKIKAAQGSDLLLQQILGNQLLGLGLYFASFLTALLALLGSVGSVSSEIENGLLHAVVSKPIKRYQIILGKFLGYGSMLSVYSLVIYASILLLNHFYNSIIFNLTDTADIVGGAFIFTLQPLVLLGIAILFSTLVRTMTAGIISIIIYGLGMLGGFLEQIGSAISNVNLVNIGIVTSLLMPSDALFRKLLTVITANDANPLSTLALGPFGVSTPPSNAMLVYTIIYVIVCILSAMWIFGKKDL